VKVTAARLLILFLLTGLFTAAAANSCLAQVHLPTVNLGTRVAAFSPISKVCTMWLRLGITRIILGIRGWIAESPRRFEANCRL